ncbi:MFS transporter [Gorillibacterium sp. CAU 1737]|uniref:MFS transporter n=1 Tax=Gorillibacterium sp. CAU 1737 TaxID=3140362 RepID=UPI0032618A94
MSFWKLQRNVKARMIERFMTHMINNCIFPFMGVYLAGEFGKSTTGALLTATILIAFLAGIFGGYLSDRIGRKKLLVTVEGLRFAAIVGMVIGSTNALASPYLVWTGLFFCYFCSGLSSPAGDALIIDSSESEERRYIYSLDYWLWNISVLVGMIIGGFFFKEHRLELFGALGVISLLSILILVFWIRETSLPLSADPSEGNSQGFLRSTVTNYRSVLRNSLFVVFLIASLIDVSVQFQFNNYGPIQLVESVQQTTLLRIADWSFIVDGYRLFGLLNIVNTVVVVLLGTWIRKRTMNRSDRVVLFSGLLLYTVGYSFLVAFSLPWLLIGMMGIVSLGEMIYNPRKQAVLADLIPAEQRGSYMAMNAFAMRGAMMIGSLSVMLGSLVPPWAMGVELLLAGGVSVLLYRKLFRMREVRTPAASDSLAAVPPA